eukprot:scaffold38552_cov30-Tisochrysis_lutea.AAC.4
MHTHSHPTYTHKALRRRAAHSFHQKADRQRANSRQRRSTSPSYGRDPSSSRSDNHPACGIIARGDKSPEADGAIGDHGPGARDCSHDFAIPAHSLSDAATAFCGPEDASPLPLGLSNASEGNFLESINLALDVLECSYEELDLASTGKSVLVLTAGSGVFSVDQVLLANANFLQPRLRDGARVRVRMTNHSPARSQIHPVKRNSIMVHIYPVPRVSPSLRPCPPSRSNA